MNKLYKTKILILMVISALALGACGSNGGQAKLDESQTKQLVEAEIKTESSDSKNDATVKNQVESQVEEKSDNTENKSQQSADSETKTGVDKELDWKNADREKITLANDNVTIANSGVYEVSGKLSEGSLIINVDKTKDEGTVYLVLNNVEIASSKTAPINIMEAKDVVIILPEGSVNKISQASIETADTEFPSAAIFSKADLFIVGSGELNVETAYNDGITSKDDLNIESGNINIVAASDGLVGKDSVEINGGNINISAGKDGVKATNDTEQGQGYIEINGGNIVVSKSDEGMEAMDISINGGNISINSSDDGINIKYNTGTLTITGGEIKIVANGDGMDSNGNITMSGGSVTIDTDAVSSDNTPVDADGTINVTGGKIVDLNGNEIDYSRQMGPGGGPKGPRGGF